ncbi:hypothetical protein AK812_SmicGene734 [Symbiodinium microadriaticum]|uniref:Copia protein n=1 Tax=Symbiodinium microadriaticum TaxID=2951 RepID=A0A1Q9F5Y5_SYMMI|nr:hypothetical protein AK812_SmicGene734 [Symbiodinium microadriaticum]
MPFREGGGDGGGSTIPAWDGHPKGWRRYAREVAWFVQGTKHNQRRYLATRLIGRLTGSARLLAMSWPQGEFDNDLGVLIYLRKLAQSPLVRRSLPNAAAIMSQYFQFKRQPGENITTFLVRETLGFEEFNEALVRLREERQGMTVDKQLFGLETLLKKEEEKDDWWSESTSRPWWKRGWYDGDEEDPSDAAGADSQEREAPLGGYEQEEAAAATTSPASRGPPEDQGGEGQTPQEGASPASRRLSKGVEKIAKGSQTDDDTFDSFILDVLRGWRLLQAASLSLEERRDVLSSTANRLDFESVSNALQVLWDEQLSGARRQATGHHPPPGGPQVYHMEEQGGYEAQWAEQGHWGEDEWYDDEGDQWQYYGEEEEPWNHEWAQGPQEPDPDAFTAAELDDGQVREALQAERAAEAMAAEAAMTWKRAQQATAAVRKDRGFGASAGSAFRAAMSTDQCHKCGSYGHFARDCKGGKGRPKGAMMTDYYEYEPAGYDAIYFVGGKGKKKGKTKGHFGMNKGATGQDHHVSSEKDAIPPTSGLLDCGATASAGPEASVQRLIAAVIEQDSQATITIDQSRRPYFRYGSGAWGRAQYHVTLSSVVSGQQLRFEVYALPNPPEFVESWFRPHMLVPILVGMSHIGSTGAGMIIDFNDGSYLNAADLANKRQRPPDDPQYLTSNSKGHFVLNIVHYLTGGQVCKQGNCSVVLKQPVFPSGAGSGAADHKPLPGTDEDLPLQYMFPLEIEENVLTVVGSENMNTELRRTFMRQMLQRHAPDASSAQAFSDSRAVEADPRDCRALRTQWPCYGHHPEVAIGNNKFAQWKSCAVCSYRLSYVPREGAPGSDSKTENFPTVRRALSTLHGDIGDVQPDAEMVRVAIEMEYANHQLIQKFDKKRAVATVPPKEMIEATSSQAAMPSKAKGYQREMKGDVPELLNPNLVEMEGIMVILTNLYRSELQALVAPTGQFSVWEVGCSTSSMLTTACLAEGLQAFRVNHVNGFDLYKEETYGNLRQLFEIHKPRRIWLSPRSDRWQPWSHLNHLSWQDRQALESRRRHERTMLKRMVGFLAWALNRNSLLEIFWEWPTESLGWKEPSMQLLEKSVWLRNRDWLQCRVDGCRYGLRLDNTGPFVKKRWTIRTTCPKFHSLFKTKVCVQEHQHVPVPVMENHGRLDYPWRFASSVAKAWKDHLFPLRHFGAKSILYNFANEEIEDVEVNEEANPASDNPEQIDGPTEEERKAWERKLRRFHTAAGHPSNSQLARIIKEAKKPKWMVDAAANFSCPHCESTVAGGMSSKQVPPLSTRPLPVAWQQVVSDVGEWTSVPHKCKLKFVVFVDAATKLRVAEPLFRCEISEMKTETGLQLVEAFSKRWLSDKPKPEIFVPDNARSYTSRHFQDFCSSVNIWVAPPAEAEAWAHGIAESVVQDVKMVMERIQTGDASLQPETCLALATGALNQTSFVKGYSSYQWAYGKQFSYTDEDEITMSQVRDDAPFAEFSRLLSLRHEAEKQAREVRAQRVLSKLKNTIQRQPLRVFHPVDLVKVWRRALPQELHRGRAGGTKKAGRHHWIGPGRVVLQETVPHQAEDDPRRHIIWVVIGGKLYRCSAHSVRPVTEQERAWHHLHVDEDPSRWKTLQDIIPSKEYTDLSGQEPPGDLPEDVEPDLPPAPDGETWVPSKRLKWKQAPPNFPLPVHVPPPVNEYGVPEDCLEYEPSFDEEEPTAALGTDFGDQETHSDVELVTGGEKREASSTDAHHSAKKPKPNEVEDELTLHTALQETEHAYVMELELNLSSHRQLQKFIRSPSAYLFGKMRDCEVRWERLTPQHRTLFSRAKTKEVTSFIQQAAVRRCLDQAEDKEEEREEALIDTRNNPNTTVDPQAMKKAKARIVLLGYQHPDLLREGFNSSAPVQSVLTRNLAYMMTVTNGWQLEGLDLSTAFLQTAPKEEMRIWTQGVSELREALGIGDDQLMRVLKDFYGSTTAPRGLWQDLHAKFTSLGATKIMSDPCMWIWSEPVANPRNSMDRYKTIGMMGGHVDDFNRAGDLQNPKWLAIRAEIDKAYKWGTIKKDNYRHAGTDVISRRTADGGHTIEVNQDQYIEGISDFNLAAQSGRNLDSPLDDREVSACRAALGALQWAAVQTQPLICARCNLILSDLSHSPKFSLAKEIQGLIGELRSSPMRLTFRPLPGVKHWQDVHVITLGDQAHANRPKGGSTGGILTFLGGPTHAQGEPSQLVLLGWKTWKLQRVAIGSTDAEVQAMVEAEDINFKTRLTWAELNSATVDKGFNFLRAAERAASAVPGILGTDSKGGYDAVMRHEGPDLGLSNARAAIQGHQLKEGMRRVKTRLIWLASDFNLSDALTKRSSECRKSFVQFLRNGIWELLLFEPNRSAFLVSGFCSSDKPVQ